MTATQRPGKGGRGHLGGWLLAPQPSLQKHPPTGTAGPSVKLGSEPLIPPCLGRFLLSDQPGLVCLWWFCLIPGPADWAGRPARPPLHWPHQHRAMVPAQRRADSGPQVSPGGGQPLGGQDAQRVEHGASPAPGDIPAGARPWPQPLAPTEGDRPLLAPKTSVLVPPWVLGAGAVEPPPAAVCSHGRALWSPPPRGVRSTITRPWPCISSWPPRAKSCLPGGRRAVTGCTQSIRIGNWALPSILISVRGLLTRGMRQCVSGSRWGGVLGLCPHRKHASKPEPAAPSVTGIYFYCPP